MASSKSSLSLLSALDRDPDSPKATDWNKLVERKEPKMYANEFKSRSGYIVTKPPSFADVASLVNKAANAIANSALNLLPSLPSLDLSELGLEAGATDPFETISQDKKFENEVEKAWTSGNIVNAVPTNEQLQFNMEGWPTWMPLNYFDDADELLAFSNIIKLMGGTQIEDDVHPKSTKTNKTDKKDKKDLQTKIKSSKQNNEPVDKIKEASHQKRVDQKEINNTEHDSKFNTTETAPQLLPPTNETSSVGDVLSKFIPGAEELEKMKNKVSNAWSKVQLNIAGDEVPDDLFATNAAASTSSAEDEGDESDEDDEDDEDDDKKTPKIIVPDGFFDNIDEMKWLEEVFESELKEEKPSKQAKQNSQKTQKLNASHDSKSKAPSYAIHQTMVVDHDKLKQENLLSPDKQTKSEVKAQQSQVIATESAPFDSNIDESAYLKNVLPLEPISSQLSSPPPANKPQLRRGIGSQWLGKLQDIIPVSYQSSENTKGPASRSGDSMLNGRSPISWLFGPPQEEAPKKTYEPIEYEVVDDESVEDIVVEDVKPTSDVHLVDLETGEVSMQSETVSDELFKKH